MSLIGSAGVALAADEDTTAAADAALDPASFAAAVSELQAQGLTKAEAKDLVQQAAGDVTGGLSTARKATEAAGQDPRGLAIAAGQTGLGLGAPDLGGHVPTAQEQAAMMKEADELRVQLEKQGFTGRDLDRKVGEEMAEKYKEKSGREGGFHGKGDDNKGEGGRSRNTSEMEKKANELREQLEKQGVTGGDLDREVGERMMKEFKEKSGEKEYSTRESMREGPSHEMTREMPTIERSSYEAPTVERSYEAPTMERTTQEYERPVYEYQGGMESH